MDLIPAVNTAPNESARRAYAEYLQTPGWRKTRDRALRLARWRCTQCHERRDLQVHHLTYDRLGHELDTDLAVLCVGCHENAHPEHYESDFLGLYLKLADDVIRQERRFDSIADFLEALKTRCARLRIPYNTDKFARAVRIVVARDTSLIGRVDPVVDSVVQAMEMAPPSAHEARQLLRKLGIAMAVKQMPDARPRSLREQERLRAAKLVAQAIQDSIATCEELERLVAEKRD